MAFVAALPEIADPTAAQSIWARNFPNSAIAAAQNPNTFARTLMIGTRASMENQVRNAADAWISGMRIVRRAAINCPSGGISGRNA